ncbi:hypothetical protein [Actinokineospora sp.]|uniref:hypothetical protein n=1 Tax=Actinokineospora sp. TaxID=1872133 RepID=UPI003D6B9AA1
MRPDRKALVLTTTINGRPALRTPDGRSVVLALTDEALTPAESVGARSHSLLSIGVTKPLRSGGEEMLARVLDELLPALVPDTEPVPAVDTDGMMPYVSTPPAPRGGIVDLPIPTQTLQLCTAMRENLGLQPPRYTDSTKVYVGSCQATRTGGREDASVGIHYRFETETFPDTVAGRPAKLGKDSVTVLLRDDAWCTVKIKAADAVPLAERLVPVLLGG